MKYKFTKIYLIFSKCTRIYDNFIIIDIIISINVVVIINVIIIIITFINLNILLQQILFNHLHIDSFSIISPSQTRFSLTSSEQFVDASSFLYIARLLHGDARKNYSASFVK